MTLCTICKDSLYIPVVLTCSHSFCLPCIKNHLFHRSFCPLCSIPVHISELQVKQGTYRSRLYKNERSLIFVNNRFMCNEDRVNTYASECPFEPVTTHDAPTEEYKSNRSTIKSLEQKECTKDMIHATKKCKNVLPDIKPFIYSKLTEPKLKKLCNAYSLRLGSKEEMINRLKDFYLMYIVEKETYNPISLYGLSAIVNKKTYKKEINFEAYVVRHIKNIDEIRSKLIKKHTLKIQKVIEDG